MSYPLVSIIMGVYNEERTISNCINSILKQTYSNWELIVCDDCSEDKTREILEDYSLKDSRIVILKNVVNMGLAASLNRCLERSKGTYIARMDADDESLPNRIEMQVLFLESHPQIDCVGCNRMIFDEHGDVGVRKSVEYPTKEILRKNTPFAHPTIMMKKSVYDRLGGYTISKETMRAEDLDLWIRFYSHNYVGYNLQEVLYRYRESLNDLKKRNLKAAIGTAKVYRRGYKALGFHAIVNIYALKPIIAAIIPNVIMKSYYKRNLRIRK